jgi:hypothetical protein
VVFLGGSSHVWPCSLLGRRVVFAFFFLLGSGFLALPGCCLGHCLGHWLCISVTLEYKSFVSKKKKKKKKTLFYIQTERLTDGTLCTQINTVYPKLAHKHGADRGEGR